MCSNEDLYETFHQKLTKLKFSEVSSTNFDIKNLKTSYTRPNLDYHLYKHLSNSADKGTYEEWLFITQKIEKTLHFLLAAPLQRFFLLYQFYDSLGKKHCLKKCSSLL